MALAQVNQPAWLQLKELKVTEGFKFNHLVFGLCRS